EGAHLEQRREDEGASRRRQDREGGNDLGEIDELLAYLGPLLVVEALARGRLSQEGRKLPRFANLLVHPRRVHADLVNDAVDPLLDTRLLHRRSPRCGFSPALLVLL